MTAMRRRLLLGFGLLGLAAASMSSYVHHQILTDPAYTSACDINATVSCTQAYLSRYGSLFGVPVALLGVLFFVVVLLLVGVGGRQRSAWRDAMPAYLLVWSTFGLAFILYLAWASYVQLGTFCILCAVTYVAVIAIFITSSTGSRTALTMLPRRAGRDLGALARSPLALLALVLFIAGAVTVVAFFPRENAAQTQAPAYPALTDQQRAELDKWWAVQPKVNMPIPNDTKVLIVKFSDYMCPACRQTYELYKPVLGKYLTGGQVKYVVKHYPLEAECNKNAPSNHYASCEAAAAVIMARPKGTSQTLEQWIFSNQETLTAESVKKMAKDIGGIQDFDAQYPRALEEVKTDAGLGGLLGVNRTPTFYIAGRKVPNETILPPQYFDYLIELALKTP